jgi:hypothetical protein
VAPRAASACCGRGRPRRGNWRRAGSTGDLRTIRACCSWVTAPIGGWLIALVLQADAGAHHRVQQGGRWVRPAVSQNMAWRLLATFRAPVSISSSPPLRPAPLSSSPGLTLATVRQSANASELGRNRSDQGMSRHVGLNEVLTFQQCGRNRDHNHTGWCNTACT